MSTRTPIGRRVIAVLLLVLLTACRSWQPTTVSPQRLITEDQPSSVRVTLMNGETVIVENATVRNDSIVASTDAGVAAAALGDVRLLEVRQFSIGKTVGLGVLLAGVAFAVSVVVYCAGDSPYASC
jgi:hypothetical protein